MFFEWLLWTCLLASILFQQSHGKVERTLCSLYDRLETHIIWKQKSKGTSVTLENVLTIPAEEKNPGLPLPKRLGLSAKAREFLMFTLSQLWVRWQDRKHQFAAISSVAQFSHFVVDPLYRWYGLNDRVVMTAGQNLVGLRNSSDRQDTCVNGGSFNYAGMYALPAEYEALQRKCLNEELYCGGRDTEELHDELSKRIAAFFGTNCCYLTSTGFGSNVLGFPAVAERDWMIVMDEKCHNSMFVGSFLSDTGARKRFKHNNMQELALILQTASQQYSNILVAVEGMYSMDGTMPPLGEMSKLKQQYKFTLYCDEAHSFLSVGRTGRGCLEIWNDENPAEQLPADLIDVRSATLSKAVGAIGGFVCASKRFEAGLRRESNKLANSCEPLPTAAILQALWALSRPEHLAYNITRLRNISDFCHEELTRQGVYVYGDSGTPMLPVYAGAPTRASELSYLLRTLGVVCPPISKPAVEMWESRVRIGLSPDFTDEDVNTLINAVVQACQKIGVSKSSPHPRRLFASSLPRTSYLEKENATALQQMNALIDDQIARKTVRQGNRLKHSLPILQAGYRALAKHGLGSGSSRFILGTFLPHLEAERMTCTVFRQPAAITYADPGLGLMSTVTALCRPIIGHKRHQFLVPTHAPSSVENGLRIAPRKSGTTVLRYDSTDELVKLLHATYADSQIYKTVYVALARSNSGRTNFHDLVSQLAAIPLKRRDRMTLLVDTDTFDWHDSTDASINSVSNIVAAAEDIVLKNLGVRVLISGSYRNLCGLSGGYLIGDRAIVEELRYSSRCYMFSTSPLPMHMAMVATALQTLCVKEEIR